MPDRCFMTIFSISATLLLAGPLAVIASAQAPAAEQDVAPAERDAAAPLQADVRRWVEQLDAAGAQQRAAAERALLELGPAALEWLPAAEASRSAEAAQRLERVRRELKTQRTERQTAAARVDLSEADTLGEALEAIGLSSGVRFDHDADAGLPIDPVERPLPFWHALDLVLDQAELDVNFYGGDRDTLELVPRHPERPSRVDSAAYSGVYRIEPLTVTARRVLNRPSLSGLNVSVQVAWESRLTPIGLTLPIDQLSGRLDDGARLQPQASGETIDVATNPEVAFSQIVLPMQLPAGQPEQIESLTGVLRALLPGKRHTFELTLGEVGVEKTVDAMTVRIEDIRRNGELYEVRLGVELDDAGRALESHRQWIFENEAYVQREDGSRVDHLGYQVYRQTTSGVGVAYLFDLGEDFQQATLHYRSPTAVVRNEVAFVLRDIPLP